MTHYVDPPIPALILLMPTTMSNKLKEEKVYNDHSKLT